MHAAAQVMGCLIPFLMLLVTEKGVGKKNTSKSLALRLLLALVTPKALPVRAVDNRFRS